MTRSLGLWIGVGVVAVVSAFVVGRALHPDNTHRPSFDLSAAAYESAGSLAGLSKAGFSGFTEAGGDGRTVISGRVVSISNESIILEAPSGQRSTLRLSGQPPLQRLEPSSRDTLRPGVTVIVRRDSGDTAEAVLVVSEP